jgi:hypothetical protein
LEADALKGEALARKALMMVRRGVGIKKVKALRQMRANNGNIYGDLVKIGEGSLRSKRSTSSTAEKGSPFLEPSPLLSSHNLNDILLLHTHTSFLIMGLKRFYWWLRKKKGYNSTLRLPSSAPARRRKDTS